VTERPIIFGGPEVRAILDGRKTQTRRAVTHRHADLDICYRMGDGRLVHPMMGVVSCPYGVPGDRLWVRETFRQSHGSMSVHYAADADEVSGGPWRPSIYMPRWASRLTLEITDVRVQRLQEISEEDARAEGVCDFANGCCLACNSRGHNVTYPSGCPNCAATGHDHSSKFRNLWDSANGKRAPWSSNPWGWALTFRRIA
jgi:hypothetical protein